MLETFSAAVNFKSLLLQHCDMPAIQNFKVIIEQASQDRSRDTFAGILASAQVPPLLTPPKRHGQRVVLSERALGALSAKYKELFDRPLPPKIVCHQKHPITKGSLTTRTESVRDCNVFFRSTTSGLAPGIIQYIVSVAPSSQNDKVDTFCIIERYGHLPDASLSDPFLSYEAFGASLWSSKMSPILEAVPLGHIICHAVSRPWVKGVILFKALNRVSSRHSHSSYFP
jgi:hypothetical protein